MFFTPELLAKRDSGFGLLWLAATLGSKSTFKKLPRRSVLTADISELCELIAEPAEPLALRLSSNLMVGVARVYKVKQEIFMTDVANCSNSLKKVVQDLQSVANVDKQLLMAQPTAKASALTLVGNANDAFTDEFDNLVADWEDFLNLGEEKNKANDNEDEISDASFETSKKSKAKAKNKKPTSVENARADRHTLTEHHDHILSMSFSGSGSGDASSSQQEYFGFDGDFAQIDGLGDELAQELGEGWGGTPMPENFKQPLDLSLLENPNDNFDMDQDFRMAEEPPASFSDDLPAIQTTGGVKRKTISSTGRENRTPSIRHSSLNPPSPAPYHQLTAKNPLRDITPDINTDATVRAKKPKRTRILLDARTELTDEELKDARAQYLERQDKLRRELMQKKLEKESNKLVDDGIWRVPSGIEAPELVAFWQHNFKVQVEARSGALSLHMEDERPSKRRKLKESPALDPVPEEFNEFNQPAWDENIPESDPFIPNVLEHLRSSEEPGAGRYISRPPSSLDHFMQFGGEEEAFLEGRIGSQRSSILPWDNAGPSSSAGAFVSDNNTPGEPADIDFRQAKSSSRNGSPSNLGGLSPVVGARLSDAMEEDFVFNPADDRDNFESQQSQLNIATLEQNSFNFLEYARMQRLSGSTPSISFDKIVPTATSTRHVATAAFYHCLVLATKDLIHLQQDKPYQSISLTFSTDN